MKILPICLLMVLLLSCEKRYKQISTNDFKEMVIQETLVQNSRVSVFKVGKSNEDEFPEILLQTKAQKKYLFDYDCELENDSIILSYYSAFLIDEDGSFRKNGIWVYTKFHTEGTFPFISKGMSFSVDSIPKNWNKVAPTKEGIYFYKNNALTMLSKEQSEKKFREKELDGFYFFPNKGRLFDRININEID